MSNKSIKVTFPYTLETLKRSLKKKLLSAIALFCTAMNAVYAQSAGGAALDKAASDIRDYVTPVCNIVTAVGCVVGIVGGIRIYNKWQNGDQDVNKEIIGYAGACLFLTLAPQFVKAFFGQ